MRLTEKLTAWVEIEGKLVEEYSVTVSEDRRTVTCWIASEAGKSFAVFVKHDPAEFSATLKLFIDGSSDEAHSSFAHVDAPRPVIYGSRGRRVSKREVNPFTFAQIVSSDDDALLASSTELGTIDARLYCAAGTLIEEPTFAPVTDEPVTKIHEKRLKNGLDHRVTLGQNTIKDPKRTRRYWNNIKCSGEPWSFIFRYRPLATLQANGVAAPVSTKQTAASSATVHSTPKRTTVPVKTEADHNPDDEERARLARLKARKRDLELEKLEDEIREMEEKRKRLKVKQEPTATGPIKNEDSVIDLT